MTRILSVEDDADLQRILSLTLSSEGFEIHYAFTGPEGFEKAISLVPDIVLCDLMLPGYGGPELIRRLKANPATESAPIVVMTAYFDAATLVEPEIRKLGVIEYMRKPVRLGDLVRVLRRLEEQAKPGPAPATIVRKGRLRLDPVSRGVWVDDKLVATLPPTRFQALLTLVESRGSVPRARIMRRVWKREDCEASLEKTIQRLREDLGEAAGLVRTTSDGYEVSA